MRLNDRAKSTLAEWSTESIDAFKRAVGTDDLNFWFGTVGHSVSVYEDEDEFTSDNPEKDCLYCKDSITGKVFVLYD